MNKISLRTKIEAVGIAVILILIAVGSVMSSVTRTISDTGDDFDTYIRNSNGNYWAATSANIQNAIDGLTDGGGNVWIPAGVFTITTSILIDEPGINLLGASMGETGTATTGTVLVMGGALPDGVIHVHNASNWPDNIAIKDIEIDGANRAYKGMGINLNHSGWIQMENLYIQDIDGYAIQYDAVHGSILKDSYIEECGNTTEKKPAVWITGTYLGWEDKTTTPVFDNVIFHPGYYGWIHVDTGAALSQVHGKIVNCYFEDGTPPDIEHGVIPGYNWVIDGNTFIEHCDNSYIRLNATVCGHTMISNNIFTYGCDNDAGNDAQISMTGVGQVTITGNEFLGSNHYALYISSSCVDISVTNNIITGDEVAIIASADDCVFTGNKLYDVTTGTGIGFYFSGVENCTIVGNNIENCDRGLILSDMKYNTIVGNVFTDCSDAEIFISGTRNRDNLIRNNIGYNYNCLFPYYAQATPPTLLANTTAYWYNTTGGWLYQIANTYGTNYYLNMSTTY